MHAYLLKNGRVLVGTREAAHSPIRTFKKAWLVEKWGTTQGLPELVSGPTDKTERGVIHNVSLPQEAIVLIADACDKAWKL